MGDHGCDYYDVGHNLTTPAELARRRQLSQPDDPISWPHATALGLCVLVGVAVFLATITFSAFEAGRRAEREAIKQAPAEKSKP